jgi:hypothetical protein
MIDMEGMGQRRDAARLAGQQTNLSSHGQGQHLQAMFQLLQILVHRGYLQKAARPACRCSRRCRLTLSTDHEQRI